MKDTQNLKNRIEKITQTSSNGVAANTDKSSSNPKHVLRGIDARGVIIGIVVGAGIFRTPSIVAANTGSSELFFGVWVLGGVISLIGAMCYAELSTALPTT